MKKMEIDNRVVVSQTRELQLRRNQESKWKSRHGFSIVELMIVLVIIGILSTLANFNMSNMIKRAKEAQLKAMVRHLTNDVFMYIHDYDLNHRWGKNYDERYLNGKLEKVLENKPYDNVYGHKNPFSASKVVLNWRSVPGFLKNPAIFITCNKRFSYEGFGPKRKVKKLRGTVVIWMRKGVSTVDAYYVNLEGKRSSMRLGAD
jgi:prepilin-type N-terminal cleavage/methylation domain-containing protein